MFSHQNFILSLVFKLYTPPCTVHQAKFQYIDMAEKEPEIVQIDNDDDTEEHQAKGPRNHHLDETMEEFRYLIREDRKDALMVKALKRRRTSQFEEMKNADVEVVLRCIKDTSCLTLCQSLEEGWVIEMDPGKDVPEGREVVLKIMQEKKLSKNVVEHIITYFDNLSAAHRYLSSAAANLSSLGKLVDAEMFYLLLHAGVQPLVQLNIPDKFLDPNMDPNVYTST